jgi:formiminotetrahydrofolate cyclodeaminase
MSEELPPLWALNKAAYEAQFSNWDQASGVAYINARKSIIAHARTIAQYEQPPVDEDEAAFNRILDALGIKSITSHKSGLAQFKRELEARK